MSVARKVVPATGQPGLSVSVLGPVRAWLGGREIDLGQTRQRTLFALLAGEPGRFVARAELIEGIWGSAPPPSAAGGVHTYVSGLRRALAPVGHELLTSKASAYALDVDPAQLDSEQFAALVADAAELGAGGDPAVAADRLADALRLWHGDAYAGLMSERLSLDRAHLQEQRIAAVELRARLLMEIGHGDLIAELAALVLDQPLHEPLHELLMRALHRAGRTAEALDVFRTARRTLITELGVEPGLALRDLHRTITSGAGDRQHPPLRAMPAPARRASSGQGLAHRASFGPGLAHRAEVERLRELTRSLVAGTGDAVWLEGGPAAGKTRLLTAAFTDAGCQVAWATADDLDRHVPLRVLARALGRPDDGRVRADTLAEQVRATCRRGPLLLVIDGIQWADDTSVRLWSRLIAASLHLPLLVVAAARPGSGRAGLDMLRRRAENRKGHVVKLGTPPVAKVDRLHADLAALDGVTTEVLRRVALLGSEFTTDDALAVTGLPAFDLAGHLESAVGTGLLSDTGTTLAFAHPLQREALCESIPEDLRVFRRRQAAEALHRGGAGVVRVAGQLAAESPAVDDWVVTWTAEHQAELLRRAPSLAGTLIHAALRSGSPGNTDRAVLLRAAVRFESQGGRSPVELAHEALKLAVAPDDREEMRHALAAATAGQGDGGRAVDLLDAAIAEPATPETWRVRHRKLTARLRRGDLTDLDRTDRRAAQLYAGAVARNEPYEAAFALQTTWLTASARRAHDHALSIVDEALEHIRDCSSFADLYLELLGDRMSTLRALDRLDDAERTSHRAALFAISRGLPVPLRTASAIQAYWCGRWDDVAAELAAAYDDAQGGAGDALYAVAALVAARRGETGLATELIVAAEDRDVESPASPARLPGQGDQEASGFLIVARALVAEQRHDTVRALVIAGELLTAEPDILLPRHLWLPEIVRLALDEGRLDLAERAAAVCVAEADLEVRPGRGHVAALRCQGLLTRDAAAALAAADHDRATGRVIDRAAALEDAAVIVAGGAERGDAARLGGEACAIYAALGARWDLARARHRLVRHGVTPSPSRDVRM
ncbi:BTAD domain-containing putative transcriptional regulator [Actinoplanes sp. NPDC051475]|uniref:BTAD domain-containing putative transcriptional regulator n=1 Tax=Actinoplanes sp. NPDC051475 TaxID=3157225 RepID=UPI00344D9F43